MLDADMLHGIMEELSKERPIFHSEADFQHALAWKIHEKMVDKGYHCEIRLELKKKVKYKKIDEDEKRELLISYENFIDSSIDKKTKKLKEEKKEENKNKLKSNIADLKSNKENYKKNIEQVKKNIEQNIHIDIWLTIEEAVFAIELKYKLPEIASPEINVNQESFYLEVQGAEDQGSYSFVLDIERLERVASINIPGYVNGYCILLTNSWMYWKQPKDNQEKKSQNNEFFPIDEGNRRGGRFLRGCKILQWLGFGDYPPLKLDYNYECKWRSYSDISLFMKRANSAPEKKYVDKYKEFKYLLLQVPGQPCLETPTLTAPHYSDTVEEIFVNEEKHRD